MSNIKGMNKEESKWICDALSLVATGKGESRKSPSKRAFEYFEKTIKEAGY